MYRVLVLTSTYPRWEGDTEPRFVLDLCRHMSEQAEILVIAPHAPGAVLQEQIDTVSVRRFSYFPTNWQTLAYQGGIVAKLRENPWRIVQVPFFVLSFYRATRRALRDFEPDLIHSHWLVPQGLIACLAARGCCPVLCTSHGGDLFGLRSKPFTAIKSWVLRKCCAVTVVSSSMVSHVRALAANVRIEVIPMGTELHSVFTPPAGPNMRRENELLFAGRLVHGKGIDKLIEALALLRSWKLDVRLRIAGDGPMKTQLAAQASRLGLSGCVEFLGSVSHSELAEMYRRATLAVFPFESQQGFGLVITEAMACGCPVIASDLPATRESVEDSVSGVLTPPGDSIRLAEEIRKYLSRGELRAKLSNAALRSVRQRFGWRAIATRYVQVIESCLR